MHNLDAYLKVNTASTLLCFYDENVYVNCLPTSLLDQFVMPSKHQPFRLFCNLPRSGISTQRLGLAADESARVSTVVRVLDCVRSV